MGIVSSLISVSPGIGGLVSCEIAEAVGVVGVIYDFGLRCSIVRDCFGILGSSFVNS